MLAAPASLACKKGALCARKQTGQPKQPASPAQWFTAYNALSSVSRSFPATVARGCRHPRAWSQHRGIGTTRLRRPRCRRSPCAVIRVHRIPPRVSWRAHAPLAGWDGASW